MTPIETAQRAVETWCARRLMAEPWTMSGWLWRTTLYWSTPILVRDYHVLVRCGVVQRRQHELGKDTPSHWFAGAAKTYTGDDKVSQLAGSACLSMCLLLRSERPS